MNLTPVHQAVLAAVLAFLSDVAAASHLNKMSTSNLAVVFAPTLFYIQGAKGDQMLKEVEIQVSTASTLRVMIEAGPQLWKVVRLSDFKR